MTQSAEQGKIFQSHVAEGTVNFEDLFFNISGIFPPNADSDGVIHPGMNCGSVTFNHGASPLPSDDSFSLEMTHCFEDLGFFSQFFVPDDVPPGPDENPQLDHFLNDPLGNGNTSNYGNGGPTPDGTGFQLSYNNYSWYETTFRPLEGTPDGQNQQTLKNLVVSMRRTFRDGSVIMPFSNTTCAASALPTESYGIINMSGFDRLNVGPFQLGTWQVDESFVNNLTIAISETPSCVVTITLNGHREFTDHVNPERSFVANDTNIQVTLTETSRNINDFSTFGNTIVQSGTVQITSACTEGTFTLGAESGNPFFVPNGAKCAVIGRYLVTNDLTGVVTGVIATPTGGIEIDRGNDGSIEDRYDHCDDAALCTDGPPPSPPLVDLPFGLFSTGVKGQASWSGLHYTRVATVRPPGFLKTTLKSRK